MPGAHRLYVVSGVTMGVPLEPESAPRITVPPQSGETERTTQIRARVSRRPSVIPAAGSPAAKPGGPPSSRKPEDLDPVIEIVAEDLLPASEPSSESGSSSSAIAEALRREEAARTVGFARAVTGLCALGVLSQTRLGGDLWIRAMFVTTTGALGLGAAWMWWLAREPLRYTKARARVFAFLALSAAIVLPHYLGVFSLAPVFVTLGITFFGLGEDRLTAIGLPLVSAAAFALLASLVVLGALPDVGVTRGLTMPEAARWMGVATIPTVYALALWQARLSRRATVDALARSNAAVREMMLREKQLEEANRDLDRLLNMGAGNVGTYTGVICGHYVLDKLVGRGAMGEVYAASDTKTSEPAAVKLLQPGMESDRNLVQRFLREGAAASKLRGPNIVTVYEVGKTADGAPYIAMELLRGHDLGWHLRHRSRLSLEEVVSVADQVAAGLDIARVAGIVHRDLKPQNIFLAQQPRAAPVWKILDFGISHLAGTTGTLTQDQIVGTPGYMSPEQAEGAEVTHRSDVFSFGALVYRSLTGEAPFGAPDTPQVLYQVVFRNPTRPSELAPKLPPDVDLVLAIALAKDKEDRFSSAREMAAALADAARSELDPDTRLRGRMLLAALPWGCSRRDSVVAEEMGGVSGAMKA
jgi:hypothetical protein